ncbi:hypothetical protein OQ519_03550 [Pseudomonas lurida]|nr:hypothetical protein [Pseudomonas lurida]MBD8668998.1 hypothetical protein [Pseudomonas lurida]UZQ75433.1 hypothetical protein OQ519_03550 [Pseudomonas lurida]
MSVTEVFELLGAALLSIAGSGVIIMAFSSWLGKVWASRILMTETHKLNKELEETKRSLDLIKENTLRFQNDKILTYRAVAEIVARLLASLDTHEDGRLVGEAAQARFDEFNEQRLRAYGYLAMLAPQAVMDAYDGLMDLLLQISNGNADYEWAEVRAKSLAMINTVRADIGIDKDPIAYNGKH